MNGLSTWPFHDHVQGHASRPAVGGGLKQHAECADNSPVRVANALVPAAAAWVAFTATVFPFHLIRRTRVQLEL